MKKARRKIKNKISAQESRKRKRDYVNNLEERISDFTSENQQLKRDLEKERSEKKTLMSQVTLGSKNRLDMSNIGLKLVVGWGNLLTVIIVVTRTSSGRWISFPKQKYKINRNSDISSSYGCSFVLHCFQGYFLIDQRRN